MMERGITRAMVKTTVASGELIEDYPDGTPYPSALFLGLSKEGPIHVVAALDESTEYCFVITAYRPDREHFEADCKTRRVE